jgi:hypothetical protein
VTAPECMSPWFSKHNGGGCPAMLAARGGCGTRPAKNAGLRQSSPTSPRTAALLGVTYGARGQKPNDSLQAALALSPPDGVHDVFDFGAPAMPPSNAGEAGDVRSRMSEPRSLSAGRVRDRPALPSSAGNRRRRRHRGSPSLGYLSWRSKKGNSPPPQGGEIPSYKIMSPAAQRRKTPSRDQAIAMVIARKCPRYGHLQPTPKSQSPPFACSIATDLT